MAAVPAVSATVRILINAIYLRNILSRAPDVAGLFDGTGSFMLCSPTSPPPSVSVVITPVGNYKSFAQARADAIDPRFAWLLYDPESWTLTPANESADPRQYMQRFGQWASTRGFRTIMAPARDLATTDTVQPRLAGETNDAWYLRTALASDGARHGDVFSIQSQADTTNLTAFGTLVTGANSDAKSIHGNPYCQTLCGLSTRYGTASQMMAAWDSVSGLVRGFWLNIPDGDYAKALAFLRMFTGR
jgi:hypothetical protein